LKGPEEHSKTVWTEGQAGDRSEQRERWQAARSRRIMRDKSIAWRVVRLHRDRSWCRVGDSFNPLKPECRNPHLSGTVSLKLRMTNSGPWQDVPRKVSAMCAIVMSKKSPRCGTYFTDRIQIELTSHAVFTQRPSKSTIPIAVNCSGAFGNPPDIRGLVLTHQIAELGRDEEIEHARMRDKQLRGCWFGEGRDFAVGFLCRQEHPSHESPVPVHHGILREGRASLVHLDALNDTSDDLRELWRTIERILVI
jgi:hypothetical protein